jgi:hypothetical protein
MRGIDALVVALHRESLGGLGREHRRGIRDASRRAKGTRIARSHAWTSFRVTYAPSPIVDG